LAIARDIGDRQLESHERDSLGLCHYSLGGYRRAIDLHTHALAIARDIGDPHGEACSLDYLGRSWLALGDAHRAVMLLEQAVRIADTTGDIDPAVKARSWLARARLQVADAAGALAAAAGRRELLHPTEEPTRRLLEGLALLELRRVEESVRAFTDALTGADALLELADRNVAALRARALTLSGLAVATGDPARAGEAGEALDRAHAVTSAAGVAEDTHRLLSVIVRQDQFEILASVRVALDL
jgi:tetratricopeptide (TPR) repeat protein